jgi:hypothetical protein
MILANWRYRDANAAESACRGEKTRRFLRRFDYGHLAAREKFSW